MNGIWTEIIIGDQILSKVQLLDNGSLCVSSDMNMQSCVLKVPQNISKLSVTIRVLESIDILKPLEEIKLELLREKSISSFWGKLLGGSTLMETKINVFYNKADEHSICVGFVSQHFQPSKYVISLNHFCGGDQEINTTHIHKESDEDTHESQKNEYTNAKDCFINNIDKFEKLILLTSIRREIGESAEKVSADWENAILSIRQSNSLHAEFLKYKQNLDAWLLHLKSWGLKQDLCKEYPGAIIDSHKYYKIDGSIDIEKQYVVLLPCWTLWKTSNGKSEEIIVSVGLIKEK